MRRAPIALLIALCVLFGALPASADAVDDAVAATRGSGLRSLGALESTANGSAASQAAATDIFHTGLGHLAGTCNRAAEIVGTGPTLQLIFMGFANSPTHWSVLSDPAWTAMGTGVATGSDGALYVSVVFCVEAGGGSPPPAPAPTPTPTPSPDPAPAPAPGASAPATPSAQPPPPSQPDVEIDMVGLLATLLTTSLDSLTATTTDGSPMAMRWDQFFVLQVGHPVIV